MDPRQLIPYVKAEPFRPFVIRLHDGRQFEIRHPEVIKPTKRAVLVFFPLDAADGEFVNGTMISPVAIATVEYAAA